MNDKSATLEIAAEFGDHLSTREIWGQKVQGRIVSLLEMGYKVRVSFKGMKTVSTSFLDEAFGKLVEVFDLDFLKKNLSFSDISDHHRANLNRAVLLRHSRLADKASK